MSADPRLRLPQSPRVALFRKIDAVLRADPIVKGATKTFRSWQGRPEDRLPLGISEAPGLRLTPHGVNQGQWSTDSMSGTLQIDCEMIIPGFCCDDLDNYWYAIERALYPMLLGDKNKLSNMFQLHFAHTGLASFSQIAYDIEPGADGAFRGLGQIQMDYRLSIISQPGS